MTKNLEQSLISLQKYRETFSKDDIEYHQAVIREVLREDRSPIWMQMRPSIAAGQVDIWLIGFDRVGLSSVVFQAFSDLTGSIGNRHHFVSETHRNSPSIFLCCERFRKPEIKRIAGSTRQFFYDCQYALDQLISDRYPSERTWKSKELGRCEELWFPKPHLEPAITPPVFAVKQDNRMKLPWRISSALDITPKNILLNVIARGSFAGAMNESEGIEGRSKNIVGTDEASLNRACILFSTLADPLRLKILKILMSTDKPLTRSDVLRQLIHDVSYNAVTKHIDRLMAAGLVVQHKTIGGNSKNRKPLISDRYHVSSEIYWARDFVMKVIRSPDNEE